MEIWITFGLGFGTAAVMASTLIFVLVKIHAHDTTERERAFRVHCQKCRQDFGTTPQRPRKAER